MGHDGCWDSSTTTSEGTEFSITFGGTDEDLGFTPDDYPTERVAVIITLSLAALAGFILGRVFR